MHWLLNRFQNAVSGLIYAIRHDSSAQTQIWSVFLFLAILGYFLWPLSQVELLFMGLAYFLIIITEVQNSAFEEALDRLHPELHEQIGRSKDLAAGSVLAAGLFLVFVVIVIIVGRV
ncbi:MAG: diacylglycerol kinase [Patescibacteria group bacterium]